MGLVLDKCTMIPGLTNLLCKGWAASVAITFFIDSFGNSFLLWDGFLIRSWRLALLSLEYGYCLQHAFGSSGGMLLIGVRWQICNLCMTMYQSRSIRYGF